MKQPPEHTALKILLAGLATLAVIGGLGLLFASRLVFHVLPEPTEPFVHIVLIFLTKAIGVVVLGLAYLLYAAAQDPVRYVAVVDAFAAMFVSLAVLDAFAASTGSFGGAYPAYLIWARVVLRVLLALALIALRPRPAKAALP